MTAKTSFSEPPEHLSEKAKSLFREYVGTEVKTAARIALFIRGLEALDMADECAKIIRRDGVAQVSKRSGMGRQHPLLNSMKTATETMLKIWGTLRLNSERGKIPWT